MLCSKIVPIVHGLEKEYANKLKFVVVDKTADGAAARIKKYGLDIHGMVITDRDDKLLWSESGHKQTAAGVRKAIDKVLSGA